MLAPDLVKRQPDLLNARNQFADRGEMGRCEIPGERVAVEIAPEPAFTVPGAGRKSWSIHRASAFLLAYCCLPAGRAERNAAHRTDARWPGMHDCTARRRLFEQSSLLAAPRRLNLRPVCGQAGAAGLDQTIAEEARPAVVVPRRGLVLPAALMAIFMPAVESSIVATALPTIIGDLGGFHLFSWVFAVPFLTMAVTIPLYGRLADLYGRKRVFFVGTAIFLIGTTLCGFARSMEVLIAVSRAAGHRRRRDPADRDDDHRRHLYAGRARPHPGRQFGGVGLCRGRRAGGQRLSGRARALVGRVLGQPADRRASASRCSRCS